jgi:thiosulfate dehydrogenase
MKQLSVALLLVAASAAADPPPPHALPKAKAGGTIVGLCDGQTSLEVTDLKPGETMSRARAQTVSDELMAAWRKKHPDAKWDSVVAQNGPPLPPLPPTPPPRGTPPPPMSTAVQRGAYQGFTSRDELVWAQETQKFVDEGNHVFHDAKLLGGVIGVSCDMCHPNAANTHPETYPKFQVQLGRVALLRDMINWCIENPVKGKALRDDDDRLRAMEAYILAQRKGTRLEYGKH